MLVPLTILLLCNYVLAYDGESRVYYDLEEAKDYFSWFVKNYNKTYTPKEASKRYQIFMNNLKTINEKNSAQNEPVFGINKFADLTSEEFKKQYTGLLSKSYDTLCTKQNISNSQVFRGTPSKFDWRDKNVVTPVKNQQTCGSCWAFSAAATIESAYAIKTGQLIDLSPQQSVDCDGQSLGCLGGFPSYSWKNIMHLGGIETWADYPYTNSQGRCAFDKSKIAVRISGCKAFKATEKQATDILVEHGPLSIGVAGDDFQLYNGGILKNCRPSRVDHAVLLVGYGTENGQDYWLIKNSWGENWGENGYIRIQRGVNACNINKCYYQVVDIAG